MQSEEPQTTPHTLVFKLAVLFICDTIYFILALGQTWGGGAGHMLAVWV